MTHSSKVARSDARFRIRQWTCAIGFRLGVGPAESLGQREGITQPEGELTFGGWGEGYEDKRHPHTLVHEQLLIEQRNASRHTTDHHRSRPGSYGPHPATA